MALGSHKPRPGKLGRQRRKSQSAPSETRRVWKNLAFRLGAEMQVWTVWAERDQGQSHCAHLTLHCPLSCSALLPVQWQFLHRVPQDGGEGLHGLYFGFQPSFSHRELPPLSTHHSPPPNPPAPSTILAHHPQALSSSPRSPHTSWVPAPRTEPATQSALSKLLGERTNG